MREFEPFACAGEDHHGRVEEAARCAETAREILADFPGGYNEVHARWADAVVADAQDDRGRSLEMLTVAAEAAERHRYLPGECKAWARLAERHGIPVDFKKRTAANASGAPYSMDANLLHISYEGGILEDPAFEPEESMWRMTVSPEKAPAKAQVVELMYRGGDVVSVDGRKLTPAAALTALNEIGGRHGVGRLDLVENRYVGMKSRGCYETPGGTILLKAHRAMESITLDREVLALKDDLAPRYARLIYNGYWFSPERKLLQGMIDASQAPVNGTVRLKLYKGTLTCVGRASPDDSLFDPTIATFDDDAGAYDQKDAAGFIKLNALRLRIAAKRGR